METKNDAPASILLVDSTETRAVGIAVALEKGGAEVVWVTQLDGVAKTGDDRILPPVTDLAIIHAGDDGWFKAAKLPVRFKRAVYYGGRGGLDPRMPPDAERVWRPLSTQTEGLSKQEAADLIAYARGCAPSGLLRPATSFPLLRTVGALCVGYLAVRAAEHSSASRPLAGDVWKRLGWLSLTDADRKRLVDSPVGLLSHANEVKDPNLWLDTIIKTAGTRDRIQNALDREVIEAGKRGLKDGKPVEELVHNLLRQPTVSPSPGVVENAFMALTCLEQW